MALNTECWMPCAIYAMSISLSVENKPFMLSVMLAEFQKEALYAECHSTECLGAIVL